ncbi:MAG: multiprotein bridging factor aMBF1 [Nanoarchaeota archaeon]
MICDMCGSEGQMYQTEIEETVLTVCNNCSKYGKVINQIRESVIQQKHKTFDIPKQTPKKELMFIVVSDASQKVKLKRESLSIKQEDFAKTINEKVSVIHHIETGKLTPSIALARKLEKALGIILVEQHEETPGSYASPKTDEFTIGDFIKIKKK